jgi:hypothetical protein
MPGLNGLLERLRQNRLAPGAAAGVLAAPSAGDELTGEVAFLFVDLDEIERERATLLAAARTEATTAEQAAASERERLLTAAREQGQRLATGALTERRAQTQKRRQALLAEADRDAAQIRARARRRTPALVADLVERLLEDAP